MSEAMTTVSCLSNNTVNTDHSGNSPLSPPVDAAVLCAIVCIHHGDFWLTSDGGYRGPNTIWREILDVKPLCSVLNPGFDPVNSDFAVALQMLQVLTEKCITPGYSSGQSFFSCNNMGPMHFKLHHKLFETLDSAAVDNEEVLLPGTSAMGSLSMVVLGILSLMQELLPDPFSFKLWPLTREKNHSELLALKSMHHILPLPAYDLTGDLIRPSAYQCCLQGALAEHPYSINSKRWLQEANDRWTNGGFTKILRELLLTRSPSWMTPSQRPLQEVTASSSSKLLHQFIKFQTSVPNRALVLVSAIICVLVKVRSVLMMFKKHGTIKNEMFCGEEVDDAYHNLSSLVDQVWCNNYHGNKLERMLQEWARAGM
ncbi:hypothetical protein EDC04DRAFT_2611836 [Pisolithus marmoratus]|nr:hypothetical protein EDC04DRAFT_2611836 [Pisolithus marmoratus]